MKDAPCFGVSDDVYGDFEDGLKNEECRPDAFAGLAKGGVVQVMKGRYGQEKRMFAEVTCVRVFRNIPRAGPVRERYLFRRPTIDRRVFVMYEERKIRPRRISALHVYGLSFSTPLVQHIQSYLHLRLGITLFKKKDF